MVSTDIDVTQFAIFTSTGLPDGPGFPEDQDVLWPDLKVLKFTLPMDFDFVVPRPMLGMSKLVVLDALVPHQLYIRGFSSLKYYYLCQFEPSYEEILPAVLKCKELEFFGIWLDILEGRGNHHHFEENLLPHFEENSIRGFAVRIRYWQLFTETTADRILAMLRKCPKVESFTLETVTDPCQGTPIAAMIYFLRALAELGLVKRVYENCLQGVARDDIYELLREKGIGCIRLGAAYSMRVPINLKRDWSVPLLYRACRV